MAITQNYKQLIADNRFQEALKILDSLIIDAPDNDTLLFDRGKLRWRMGDRQGATGDYAKASSLNPDSPAVRALENARDIADFFNPDLYNP